MTNIKIIALAGYPNSGKDEFARFVDKQILHIINGHHYKFAEGIIDSICFLTGKDKYFIKELSLDSVRKETELLCLEGLDGSQYTYRELAITVGEGYRKVFNQDVWANTLIEQLKLDYDAGDLEAINFITDLRRPNEYELTKSFCESYGLDFYLIYIDRAVAKQKLLGKYGSEAKFPEPEQYHNFLRNKADLIISNEYDLYTYHHKIETILKYDYRFQLGV